MIRAPWSTAQRMPAAGFGKALDQDRVAGVQKDEAHLDVIAFKLAQLFRQVGNTAAAAHVRSHGDTLVTLTAQVTHQLGQQRRRQIVYTVIAAVFKHIEGD